MKKRKLCLWCGKNPVYSQFTTEPDGYDESSNRCKECAVKQDSERPIPGQVLQIYDKI